MEKGKIDLENITLEDLKEEYKNLVAENAKLKNDLESVKSSKDFYLKQYESEFKKISELKGTLLCIAKLAQSDLK